MNFCMCVERPKTIGARHVRKFEIVNGSKLNGPVGIGRTTYRRHSRRAVRWSVSPHPNPLPQGEGEPFSPRSTTQARWLSTARCALFPLPEGEGWGEGKRRELPLGYRTIPGTVELDECSGFAGGFAKFL